MLWFYAGDSTNDGGSSNHICGKGLSVPQGQGKSFYCSPPAAGRYVFVRIPGRSEYLSLCEVEVY